MATFTGRFNHSGASRKQGQLEAAEKSRGGIVLKGHSFQPCRKFLDHVTARLKPHPTQNRDDVPLVVIPSTARDPQSPEAKI